MWTYTVSRSRLVFMDVVYERFDPSQHVSRARLGTATRITRGGEKVAISRFGFEDGDYKYAVYVNTCGTARLTRDDRKC